MKKKHWIFASLFLVALGVSTFGVSGSFSSFNVEANAEQSLILEKDQGYTLKFKGISGATKYVVYDDNDYRNEITINVSDKDENGYYYYRTEVVGKHNVYVKAFTSNGVIKSNTVTALENKEVFDYSIAIPVFYYDIRDGSSGTYSVLKDDGTYEYVTQSDFNANYIKNRNGIIDFTTTEIENYKFLNIISKSKEAGSNVLVLDNRFCDMEQGTTWWWNHSFSGSVLERMMDIAWSIGMKCIICDFPILTYSELDQGASTATARMADAEVKKACMHPAFYGIELNDEPLPVTQSGNVYSEIENTGRTVKAILEAWHNDADLSALPDPVLHTDLASYNDVADGYFDNGPEEYLDYLENWLTYTGLDYLAFDYYTYTTYEYGTKKIGSTTYHYDSSKVIYDCINSLREEYPDVTISQTLTRSNSRKRNTIKAEDVFASTLLAVSEGNVGYSTYTFLSTYECLNAMVDATYQKTSTFAWSEEANQQYEVLTSLLDGFTLSDNEISDYAKTYLWNTYSGYGNGVRTSTSIFAKDNGDCYQMIVNFNTGDASTTSVSLYNGQHYYLFGKDYSSTERISDGTSVTLNNGQAILIKNFTSSPILSTDCSVMLAYTYQISHGELVTSSDEFAVKVAVNNTILKAYSGYDTYGIYAETSSKNHYFSKDACTLENDGDTLYVIIRLGSVLTEQNTKDIFTVRGYAVTGSGTSYSALSLSFSVNSLISDLYEDEDTRETVSFLYQYLVNHGLLDE